MHILLLPSWYPKTANDVSGVFFRDQALALHKYGHKVGVVAPQLRSLRSLLGNSSKQSVPDFEIDEGLVTYRKNVFAALPRIPYGNYMLFKRTARKLLIAYIERHGTPDILHAHAAVFAGATAVDLGRYFGIPVVLTEHSTGFAREIYSHWQLKLSEQAFARASSCISVSPALGDLLGKQFSSVNKDWKWIPNVVADRFKAPAALPEQRRPVRFVNLALMTEKKGQFDLIEAFAGLVKAGADAELWLGGDGPIKSALTSRVHELGLSEKVQFLGLIEPGQVPDLLRKADVMVVASHYETFGVVAAEALMAGLPVIATRCGGPECIVERGDGVLVPPKQPAELQAAMLELFGQLSTYNRKDIAARAMRRFSGPAVADCLTQEYERVLSRDFPLDGAG